MSNIVERCETLLNDKKMSTVNFRNSDYVWEIGANILNELVRVFGQYDSVEFMVNEKSQSTTGWLLGIEYVIHPRNDIFRLVHKVSSYAYRDSDKIDAMRYMSTVNPYHSSNFIPAIKNNFNNWKSKLKCDIKNVIFSNPATIVFWDDGTKTVVKANGDDPYDPEKGLAIAITKKFFGTNKNKSNYYDIFKKWLPKEEKETKKTVNKVVDIRYYTVKELSEIFNISRDKVRNNIKNGLYPNAIKQSGAWLIPYNDFKSMLSKKNCSTCEYVKSPVSPYDDPLHPCNLCSLEKKND